MRRTKNTQWKRSPSHVQGFYRFFKISEELYFPHYTDSSIFSGNRLWGGDVKIENSMFRSQIEIFIMKSVSEDECEWLLIYNHDDLKYLDIEINSLKKIIFQLDLSWKLASKKRLKEILKEIGKENEFWKIFFIEFDFLI